MIGSASLPHRKETTPVRRYSIRLNRVDKVVVPFDASHIMRSRRAQPIYELCRSPFLLWFTAGRSLPTCALSTKSPAWAFLHGKAPTSQAIFHQGSYVDSDARTCGMVTRLVRD